MVGNGALDAIDRLVDDFVVDEPVPGVAYGVISDGGLIHTRGVGTTRVGEGVEPTADTVFRIASMTKSFTAAAVLLLRDAGLLRLDDPAVAFVPELAAMPTITVRQLLTMSAGLPTDDPWGDRQQDLDLARFSAFLRGGASFAWTPGTAFEYSNLGYGILGRVVSNVAGKEYRDVVRERVLEPLEMSSTVYEAGELPVERLAVGYLRRDDGFVEVPFDGYGALAAMGGLFSTVRDLATWVVGFVRAYDDETAHPLDRASRLEMQQSYRVMRPELTWSSIREPPTASIAGYGFGLFIRHDLELGTIVAHSGGYPGFGSHMRWHPASGLGVVVLGNRTYVPASQVGERMLRSLIRAEVAPSRGLRATPVLGRARDAVERLLEAWDDELAAATFSMNVDLDEPLEIRRAVLARIREIHGAFHRSAEPVVHDSPFHAAWWLEAERGRVRVEITLDPEPEPRVQSLDVTSVPDPDQLVREAAERLVGSVNAQVPEGEAAFVRTLFGVCTLGRPIAGGATGATYRVTGERGELELAISIDAESGELIATTWTPATVRPPLFNVR